MNDNVMQASPIEDATIVEEVSNDLNEEFVNTETNESSEEDKQRIEKEKLIQMIKDSKKTYKPKKSFGVLFKKERKRKNKNAKSSRRANRK